MSDNASEFQVLTAAGPEATALNHPIQVMAKFLRIVLFRREILIVSLLAAISLGGLYYMTATRIYRAEAELLVIQTGQDDVSATMPGERVAKDLMPTYTRIATSEAVLSDALKLIAPEHRIDFAGRARSDWPGVVRENLSVTAARSANILSIAYSSRDPEASKAIVDAVLTAYVEFMNDLYRNTAADVSDVLNKRRDEIEREIAINQKEKERIQNEAKSLSIRSESGTNAVVSRAIELNTSWTEAHKKRLAAQSQLVSLQQAIQRGEDLQQYALAMVESVGSEFVRELWGLGSKDAYTVSQTMQQLLKDKAEVTSSLSVYGPNHRIIRNLVERIRVNEQFLQNHQKVRTANLQQLGSEQLGPALLSIAQQQYESALLREQNLRASFEEASIAAIALNDSEVKLEDVDRKLSSLFAQEEALVSQVRELALGQDNGVLKTEVIRDPEAPKQPSNPQLVKTFALSLFLGAFFGLAIIYILDLLDDRFRSPEEIQMQLGVPVLAMIRKLEPLNQVGPNGIHVNAAPTGVEAESFRTLRTALAFIEGGATRLVVTSTEPGDGKTTISVNLATTVAQSGKRTLLIDADMRRPGLTPLVNLRGQRGLSTLLRDTSPLNETIQLNLVPDFIENLDIIPAGPRPVNPMELLASDRFADLVAWAETVYEQIVIDSPPVLAVSDSAIIGRLLDGIVLTVRPEKNRRRLVVRAVESFPPMGVNVLGVVINSVDGEKSQDYGYGYGYGYEYDHDAGAETEAGQPQRPRRVSRGAA